MKDKDCITSKFIEKAKNIHGDKYDYSLVEYKNSHTKVKIKCKIHGVFHQTPNKHLKKHGCRLCANLKMTLNNESFIEKSKKIHGDKYDYSLVEYKNSHIKVEIKCKIHGVFTQKPNNHLNGSGCYKCSLLKKSQKEYIDYLNKIHNNKYDYSLTDLTEKKIIIICPVHGKFTQLKNNHFKGCGCSKCFGNGKLSLNDFITRAERIHGKKYDYSLVEYKNNSTKVNIICQKHGIFKQRPIDHLNGYGCPKCKTSKGEIQIKKILENKNIKFIQQYKFGDCKYKNHLYFDFYLPDRNMCIEFDGKHHFETVKYWGGDENFKRVKIRDEIKNKYCIDNNIQLIRIRYDEDINIKLKNIM